MASTNTVEFGTGSLGIVTKTLFNNDSSSVVVTSVVAGSQAAQKGVEENDILVSIGAINVSTHEEAAAEIKNCGRPVRAMFQKSSILKPHSSLKTRSMPPSSVGTHGNAWYLQIDWRNDRNAAEWNILGGELGNFWSKSPHFPPFYKEESKKWQAKDWIQFSRSQGDKYIPKTAGYENTVAQKQKYNSSAPSQQTTHVEVRTRTVDVANPYVSVKEFNEHNISEARNAQYEQYLLSQRKQTEKRVQQAKAEKEQKLRDVRAMIAKNDAERRQRLAVAQRNAEQAKSKYDQKETERQRHKDEELAILKANAARTDIEEQITYWEKIEAEEKQKLEREIELEQDWQEQRKQKLQQNELGQEVSSTPTQIPTPNQKPSGYKAEVRGYNGSWELLGVYPTEEEASRVCAEWERKHSRVSHSSHAVSHRSNARYGDGELFESGCGGGFFENLFGQLVGQVSSPKHGTRYGMDAYNIDTTALGPPIPDDEPTPYHEANPHTPNRPMNGGIRRPISSV
jgi:hypothetical protein